MIEMIAYLLYLQIFVIGDIILTIDLIKKKMKKFINIQSKWIEKEYNLLVKKIVSKIKRGFKDYLKKTKNTICGRHPLMILNRLNETTDFTI